jgi:hypothetical protein
MIGVGIAVYMIIPGTVSGIADLLSILDRSKATPIPDAHGETSRTPVVNDPTEPLSTSDPWRYCAQVGTVDGPDDRFVGDSMPYALMNRLISEGIFAPGLHSDVQWRCEDGTLRVCVIDLYDWCSSAYLNVTPDRPMIDYCYEHPDEEIFPGYIQGHGNQLIQWRCKDGIVIGDKSDGEEIERDARGFISAEWSLLPQEVVPDEQTSP